jgi:2,5-diketo-D-gluconate reductase A
VTAITARGEGAPGRPYWLYRTVKGRSTVISIPTHTLNDGTELPAIGLGTWPMDDATAEQAVDGALRMGYRLVDTATNYRNETGVGRGIARS